MYDIQTLTAEADCTWEYIDRLRMAFAAACKERDELKADNRRLNEAYETMTKDLQHMTGRLAEAQAELARVKTEQPPQPVRSAQKSKQKRHTRAVVRVDERTGEVVRFPSVTAAQESIGGTPLSMSLLTNRPLKGYRFYYADDWKG